jgi:hypothetical protein
MNFGMQQYQETCQPMRIDPIGVIERLRREQDALEKRLASVNEAIEAVEANPAVERVLEALAKI